jgi:hypothetical protein
MNLIGSNKKLSVINIIIVLSSTLVLLFSLGGTFFGFHVLREHSDLKEGGLELIRFYYSLKLMFKSIDESGIKIDSMLYDKISIDLQYISKRININDLSTETLGMLISAKCYFNAISEAEDLQSNIDSRYNPYTFLYASAYDYTGEDFINNLQLASMLYDTDISVEKGDLVRYVVNTWSAYLSNKQEQTLEEAYQGLILDFFIRNFVAYFDNKIVTSLMKPRPYIVYVDDNNYDFSSIYTDTEGTYILDLFFKAFYVALALSDGERSEQIYPFMISYIKNYPDYSSYFDDISAFVSFAGEFVYPCPYMNINEQFCENINLWLNQLYTRAEESYYII